jgi:iron complex outermembrane recepter protein
MTPAPVPAALRDRNAAAHIRCVVLICFVFGALASVARMQPASSRSPLAALSLEQLMQVEVTTVSKHREKLTSAPAAIFSLNADDLKRSSVLTLPDALRLVPGLQVARVDSHNWAVGARGFADVFSNKLLVLRDGRSVYTPLFSGVFWDTQETILFDIEQIEVVRGPGATLWGANAVNGVINILTKPAADTQGALAGVTVGSDPHYSARVRYGGALDPSTHYRVYAKYTQHDDSPALSGGRAQDDWNLGLTGFRVDRQTAAGAILTLQGEAFRGREKQVYVLPLATPPFVSPSASRNTFDGANLLGRLVQRSAAGELTVQGYFDYTGRELLILGETRRTYDIEAHYRFNAPGQEITVGSGYRSTGDHVRNTSSVTLTPSRRRTDLWNAFVQDDIAVGKAVHLIVGSKVEHNAFTGWEVQPGARLLLTPGAAHTAWASVARAVRTPSRAEDDVRIRQIGPRPGIVSELSGNRSFKSEQLTAFEAGYRFHVRERFSIDTAVFLNRYRDLRTSELAPISILSLAVLSGAAPPVVGLPPPTLPFTIFATAGNKLRGETYGGEVALATQLARGWRVRASYSHLDIALHRMSGSNDLTGELDEGRSPRDQGTLWSQHDFSEHWRFDGILRAVSRLSATRVPGYLALDLRIAWRPNEQCEVSLNGRNLLDRRHPEFVPATILTQPTETARSVYAEVKFGF